MYILSIYYVYTQYIQCIYTVYNGIYEIYTCSIYNEYSWYMVYTCYTHGIFQWYVDHLHKACIYVVKHLLGAHHFQVRLAQYNWVVLKWKRPWLVTGISAFTAHWVSAIPLCGPLWTGKICICVCQWGSTSSNILFLFYVYVVNVLFIYNVYVHCIYIVCTD